MDLSCSAGRGPSARAASDVQAPARRWPHAPEEASVSPPVGVCADAHQSQPHCWEPHAPFLQINLLFGPHPFPLPTGRLLLPLRSEPGVGAWQGPLAPLLEAVGEQQAIPYQPPQSCTADGAIGCVSPSPAPVSVDVSLAWPHAAGAGGPVGRREGGGGNKLKHSSDHLILLCGEKAPEWVQAEGHSLGCPLPFAGRKALKWP